jgi:hypothetical protein
MLRAGMPRGWSAGERAVALVLADICNDRTRTPPDRYNASAALCEELDITPGTLGNILAKLAARGFELRVPIGGDRNGRPLYAVKGHAVAYRFPVLPPRGSDGPLLDGASAPGSVDNLPSASPDGPLGDGASGAMVHPGVAYGPSPSGPLTPMTPPITSDPTSPRVSHLTTSVEGARTREVNGDEFEAERKRQLAELEAWMREHPECT